MNSASRAYYVTAVLNASLPLDNQYPSLATRMSDMLATDFGEEHIARV
jgi:hypothetical protein